MVVGGLLVGPLGRARVRAQEAGCRANVKQMAMAMEMYAADYEDRLPPAERWHEVLSPYLMNTNVYICPARPDLPRGYAMNARLSAAPRSAVVGEGQAPLLFETDVRRPRAAGSPADAAYRHPGGAFFGYADGSVGLRKAGDDWSLATGH